MPRIWIAAIALLAACGSKKDSSKNEETPPVKKAPAADAAPPPTPPDAAPPPFDPAKLAVERCELDGPPVVGGNFASFAGDVAVGPDGAVVMVVGSEMKEVRRYLPVAGPTCKLALDLAFAEQGILKTAEKVESIAFDREGRLLIATEDKITRYAGAQPEVSCTFNWTPHTFAVLPDGKLLVNVFGTDLSVTTIDPAGCTSTVWRPAVTIESLPSLDVVGDEVFVSAAPAPGKGFLAWIVAPDGSLRRPLEIVDELNDDKNLCNPGGAFACGPGVCVVDNNCRALKIYGADGTWLSNLKLEDYPWINAAAGPVRGTAYLVGSISVDGTDQVLVQRLRGI